MALKIVQDPEKAMPGEYVDSKLLEGWPRMSVQSAINFRRFTGANKEAYNLVRKGLASSLWATTCRSACTTTRGSSNMPEQTKERLRVDGMRLWLGAVFTDLNGDQWIYVGQSKTKEGENACFYPAKYPDSGMIWKCAFRDALEGMFVNLPDLMYGKVEETGWGQYELRRQMHLGKPIMKEHCSIETNRQCGCGFGQCARGLIY